MQYKYSLDKSSKKFICPSCGKKTFVRYIDVNSNNYLDDNIGRCDRESKCKYHISPKGNTPITTSSTHNNEVTPSFYEENVIQQFGNSYDNNNFVQFLLQHFSEDQVIQAIEDYVLCTCNYWHGATIFWQIDENFTIRAGKTMLYNKYSGKRIKQPFPHINWMHKILQQQDFVLQQCLFGLHLLKLHNTTNAICIVESEKTAIIMSLLYPNYLWLATGSKANFKLQLLKPLKGYSIIAFPDKTEFCNWNATVIQLNKYGYTICCSTFLEEFGTTDGCDLVDLVIE